MKRQPSILNIKSVVSFLLSLLMVLSLFAPLTAHAQEPDQKVVRVGWYQSDCFQEGTSDEEEKSGYCYEYLQKVADYIDLKYEYVYGGWSDLFTMLENGEIDFLAGVSLTEERKEKMLFPDQAMGTDVYCLYKKADNTAVVPGDNSTINGKRIGGVHNNRMTLLAVEWAKANDLDAEIVYFNSFEEMDAAFENGEVDLITGTQNNVLQLDNISIVAKVGEEPYYLAVNKQREDLLAELNQALSTLQEMDPFLLQNLQYANYGATVANRTLSSGEEQWINSHDTLRVGYLENYAPFCSKSDNGAPTGIMTDVLEHLWSELGLTEKIKIEYHSFAGTDELEQTLQSGNIDVILPISRDLWYLEKKGIDSTSAVITCNENLFFNGRKDPDHINTLAVNENNTMQIQFTKSNYPEAELIFYIDIKACLDAVVRGDADGTIVNGYRTAMVTGNSSYKTLSYIPVSGETARCFGVNETNSSLLLLLNRGLKIVGSDYGASIANKYVSELYSYTATDFIKDNIIWLSLIILVFAAVIIGVLLRNASKQEVQLEEIKTLNDELEERQAQLEEASAEQEAHIEEISLLNDRLTQQNSIVASAGLGTWNIYLKNDAAPRMRPDEKMRELLGIEGMELSEEEIYSFWHDRILPDALESVNNSVSKIISGVFDENTYRWKHPVNGVIYVRCGGNAITLSDGTIILSGYHADVTDIVFKEKKQQEALEEAMLEAKKANEAKSRFLSRMSHDIRTPLNGIIGLIELSDRHPDDINAIIAGKEKARVASQHLLSLVNDVLELSKLDDSNVKLAHEPFNILELAGDVLTITAASAAEYGVSLTHEDCAQEFKYPYVYGSPLHVRQILLNIFSNAAKYNHPGGSIYCRGRFEGKTDTSVTYTVEIEDTGIGMSLEFMEQLFEPFTQEHTDARSTFQGTGLGMAIVKSLVDKMNGTISVESEEGKGSKFTVTIPFELAGEADMPKKTEVEEKDIAGMKILLVEDNELNMEIARSILEDFGAIITEAKNGQEAVDIFEQNAPGTFDAILMDVMMPVLDGYGATRKIRELSREDAKKIPIIAMTANAFEEDKQNALKAGMNGHIAKPIEVKKLIETLAGILG